MAGRMQRGFRRGLLVAVALVVGVAGSAHAAERRGSPAAVAGASRAAALPDAPHTGQLLGTVTRGAGIPAGAIVVSASGPAGTVVTRCEFPCRFEFRGLLPGVYLLRAHHAGPTVAGRAVVEVKSGLSTFHALQMERSVFTAGRSTVLAAGVAAGLEEDFLQGLDGDAGEQPRPAAPVASEPADDTQRHDHAEKLWRLRRARRSVLKDEAAVLRPAAAAAGNRHDPASPRPALPGGPATDVMDGFALSGQFHLLTRMNIDVSGAPWSIDRLPGQVTYLDIGPAAGGAGENGWGVRGAVTAGAGGSWVLAGSYATSTSPNHDVAIDASYSRQRSPRDGAAQDPTGEAAVDLLHRNREAGSVAADGTWVLSPRLSFGYGATVAHYGYLEDSQLVSPRVQVAAEPFAGTRVRAAVIRNMSAPGGQEFLRPVSGAWLPPERTFAPLAASGLLEAERTRHIEVALERDLGSASVISVRRFSQDVSGQMVTVFGLLPGVATADHYYLANAGGARADGWGVRFDHALAGRIHGMVDYSVAHARWTPWASAEWASVASGGIDRAGPERLHDITTSVETEIPETATRVILLARVNSSFTRADSGSVGSGLDTRFAFRVKQALPFTPFSGSDWEVLVDVRNLFYEQVAGASIYDELLVLNPPKQIVGGLVVHF